jgi:hypothetical protein
MEKQFARRLDISRIIFIRFVVRVPIILLEQSAKLEHENRMFFVSWIEDGNTVINPTPSRVGQLYYSQYQNDANYLRANNLLVECLNLAYVSDRQGIIDRLLLPPAGATG